MPTYTYACRKCEHTFDVFHGMSESPKVRCQKCKGASRRMLGTGAGIIFKGGGFYETDYKKKNGAGAKSESKTSGEGAAKTASKSESKSTAKAAKAASN